MGDVGKAVSVFERIVKLKPENASFRCLLAMLYRKAGQSRLATPHLKFLAELDPYDLDFIRRFQRLSAGQL